MDPVRLEALLSRCDNPLKPRALDLRPAATDGALVPVSTRAEVLLVRPHHPLQGAHVGSVQEWGKKKGR